MFSLPRASLLVLLSCLAAAPAWPDEPSSPMGQPPSAEEMWQIIQQQQRQIEAQAQAILDLRLHRLTGLEQGKIVNEYKDILEKIDDLLDIMTRLRDPESGCPWDVEQDFSTIAPYTIEEAYEVADAIQHGRMDELKDELGDLLFQIDRAKYELAVSTAEVNLQQARQATGVSTANVEAARAQVKTARATLVRAQQDANEHGEVDDEEDAHEHGQEPDQTLIEQMEKHIAQLERQCREANTCVEIMEQENQRLQHRVERAGLCADRAAADSRESVAELQQQLDKKKRTITELHDRLVSLKLEAEQAQALRGQVERLERTGRDMAMCVETLEEENEFLQEQIRALLHLDQSQTVYQADGSASDGPAQDELQKLQEEIRTRDEKLKALEEKYAAMEQEYLTLYEEAQA